MTHNKRFTDRLRDAWASFKGDVKDTYRVGKTSAKDAGDKVKNRAEEVRDRARG